MWHRSITEKREKNNGGVKKSLGYITLLIAISVFVLSGCADTSVLKPAGAGLGSGTGDGGEDIAGQSLIVPDEGVAFSVDTGFYDQDISLEMLCPEGSSIYYTTDGSSPVEGEIKKDEAMGQISSRATKYESPIEMKENRGSFPAAYIVRAVSVDEAGKISDEYIRSYFLGENAKKRFTTPVFSIWGDPRELTDEPDGILAKENYKARGKDSERAVYIEALDTDASVIFSQTVGARVYGGYSRADSIKSLKLTARKEYGAKKIKFPLFNTPVLDGEDIEVDDMESGEAGDTVKKYKRLVLRNAGNDYQFAFFRDELNQILARKAGLCDTEGVYPVVAYINGEYYGYFWLHENYCDSYFKSVYGDGDGEFVIVEGCETEKNEDEDHQEIVDEFNSTYEELINLDLTDDENYARVDDFIDVENYLDYYAFNIYVNNWDWPQNNYKCYRYCPAEGEPWGTGRFDGRWRFLFHDMDYSYSLYGQEVVKPDYDNYSHITTEGDERYSPLFVKLMERPELKEYYQNKIAELEETVLEPTNWEKTMREVDAMRSSEMIHYYKHLDNLKKAGDDSIWTFPGRMTSELKDISYFIKHRNEYITR